MRTFIVVGILIGALVYGGMRDIPHTGFPLDNTYSLTGGALFHDRDTLTFSNTQEWDPDFIPANLPQPQLLRDSWKTITLNPPPTNTSAETARELTELHVYERMRTATQLEEIKREVAIEGVTFGSTTMMDITDPAQHPHTYRILKLAFNESMYIMMHFKEKFDRVRPNILDPSLTTAIPVPGHPSYPSGHAVQSHLIALILGDIRPSFRDVYEKDAERITKNRIIAGLHYESDAAAGVSLAQEIYNQLRSTQWYATELEKAKKEW